MNKNNAISDELKATIQELRDTTNKRDWSAIYRLDEKVRAIIETSGKERVLLAEKQRHQLMELYSAYLSLIQICQYEQVRLQQRMERSPVAGQCKISRQFERSWQA